MRQRRIIKRDKYEKIQITENDPKDISRLMDELLEKERKLMMGFKIMMESEGLPLSDAEKTCFLISLELISLRKNNLEREYKKALYLIDLDLREFVEMQVEHDDAMIEDKYKNVDTYSSHEEFLDDLAKDIKKVDERINWDNDYDDEYAIMNAIANGYGDIYGL